MNVVFVYDNENEKNNDLVNNIENKMKELKIEFNISKKNKVSRVYNKNYYIIILNKVEDLENVKNCFKAITMVITEDITYDAIYSIAECTKNICYYNMDIFVLVKRIYEVYKSSN